MRITDISVEEAMKINGKVIQYSHILTFEVDTPYYNTYTASLLLSNKKLTKDDILAAREEVVRQIELENKKQALLKQYNRYLEEE